jgi:hypothetical protein
MEPPIAAALAVGEYPLTAECGIFASAPSF